MILTQLLGRGRGQHIEFNHMTSDLINCTYWNPVKTRHESSGEIPWLAILLSFFTCLCVTETNASWGHERFMFETLPDFSLCVSPFGWFWFISLCYNKTVVINISFSWALWFFLANYQTWEGCENAWIYILLVRIKGSLLTPKLMADSWSEGRLVEAYSFNLKFDKLIATC